MPHLHALHLHEQQAKIKGTWKEEACKGKSRDACMIVRPSVLYVCLYVCMCVAVSVNMFLGMYVCLYVCMYVCMYVNI